jgi:hypothetical protein
LGNYLEELAQEKEVNNNMNKIFKMIKMQGNKKQKKQRTLNEFVN